MKAQLIPVLAVLAMAMASAGAAAQPVPALDHSSPVNALIAKGFPSPDRTWTPQDYEAAVKALAALAKADPLTLPRAGSPQSGPVFARLVAEDNLEPIRRDANIQQAFNALERHLPALYPYLLPDAQQKLPALLEAIAAKVPEEALKQAVQRIRATLPKGPSGGGVGAGMAQEAAEIDHLDGRIM